MCRHPCSAVRPRMWYTLGFEANTPLPPPSLMQESWGGCVSCAQDVRQPALHQPAGLYPEGHEQGGSNEYSHAQQAPCFQSNTCAMDISGSANSAASAHVKLSMTECLVAQYNITVAHYRARVRGTYPSCYCAGSAQGCTTAAAPARQKRGREGTQKHASVSASCSEL
jgi:hypothetical protein